MTNSPHQETVRVDLGPRSYDIIVGSGLLARTGEIIAPSLARPFVFILTDENVAAQYLAPLKDTLARSGITCDSMILPPGEATKTMSWVEKILSRLLDAKVERGDTILALGGGVVGDITGFAASILRRGVNFIQIPTTLLAQVDSSVGGKTGINMSQGKNLVGSFYQPGMVLADVELLATLPDRELRAGYAEVVKYGLIRDPEFFVWLEEHGAGLLSGDAAEQIAAIARSCRNKADIVAQDERESGVRALLNFGHTFGHALEVETGYSDRVIHGEGVAIGMTLAMQLSCALGMLTGDDVERARSHLRSAGLPTSPADIAGDPLSTERLVGHMLQDKKVKAGQTTFVLMEKIGTAVLSNDVDMDDVAAVLDGGLHKP